MPSLSTRSGLAAKGLGFLASNSPVGQQIYKNSVSGFTTITATGQLQWTFTVPAGVTSISVLCVGAGGFSTGATAVGGAGGALAYTNDYSVTPGQTFTVIVGQSGNWATTNGNLTSSRNTTFGGTICGAGGGHSDAVLAGQNPGGVVLYGTGGAGGQGTYSGNNSGGGGGAGGYSGAGGNGASGVIASTSGSGGGGGGGGSGTQGGYGGGVGIYGVGANGVGGSSSTNGFSGTGGSGGLPITSVQAVSITDDAFGGGAGGIRNSASSSHGLGGNGVVRIVWPGNIRQFPSTNVGNF